MFKGQTQRQIPLLFFIIVKMDLFEYVRKAFHSSRLLFVPLNLEEFCLICLGDERFRL